MYTDVCTMNNFTRTEGTVYVWCTSGPACLAMGKSLVWGSSKMVFVQRLNATVVPLSTSNPKSFSKL